MPLGERRMPSSERFEVEEFGVSVSGVKDGVVDVDWQVDVGSAMARFYVDLCSCRRFCSDRLSGGEGGILAFVVRSPGDR